MFDKRRYGITDGFFRDPSFYSDVTSLCSPRWPSEYTWTRLNQQLRTLTSWEDTGVGTQNWTPELKLFGPELDEEQGD